PIYEESANFTVSSAEAYSFRLSAHSNISAPRRAADIGANNDHLSQSGDSSGGFGTGVRNIGFGILTEFGLRLHGQSAADVQRRCVPPVQFRDSPHSSHHGLHGQAPEQPQPGMPGRDGAGSGTEEGEQARRGIVEAPIEARPKHYRFRLKQSE